MLVICSYSTAQSLTRGQVDVQSKTNSGNSTNDKKVDVSSLDGKTYNLYLQPGKTSLKFEWENPEPARPHPKKPSDFLPNGMDYFEVNIGDKILLFESSDFFYHITNKPILNHKTFPESERYRIQEFSTNSDMLANGKFRIVVCYDYPPKMQFGPKVLYVYCEELKRDLLELGIK